MKNITQDIPYITDKEKGLLISPSISHHKKMSNFIKKINQLGITSYTFYYQKTSGLRRMMPHYQFFLLAFSNRLPN